MTDDLLTRQQQRRRYRYRARDADGTRHNGTIEALNGREARTLLMEQGLEPTRVRERGAFSLFTRRVKQLELMHFSRQLAVFVRADIPVLEAIDGLAENATHPTMRRTLIEVGDALRSGRTLSEAFSEHPKVFPPIYLGAVRASERTGRLDTALDRLAAYIERAVDNRRKLISAFTYPALVIVIAVIVVILLSVYVIPRFEGFFDSLGSDLPWTTRILVNTMDFLAAWGLLLGVLVLALMTGMALFSQTATGRRLVDATVLKLPAIGNLVSTAIVERFCFALGSMVEAAVTLPDALEIAGEGTNNKIFERRIARAREQMIEGEGLAEPIAATDLFPIPAIQMMRAGERAGTLEIQLLTASEFYNKELDYRLDRYTAWFEPAIIVIAGLIVGFVAIALVSAIYGLIGATEL